MHEAKDDETPPAGTTPAPRPAIHRRAKIATAAALVIVSLVALAAYRLMSTLPTVEGRLVIDGLAQPATIARDTAGVPRITAGSPHDAYLALGYAHAQDRMWQMETQRRVGAGRLAELVGERGLANDRFMRTLGLYRLAEAGADQLDQPTRDALAAYAEGVNAWLATHRNRLPLEYTLLGAAPEPWRPADSLVWARLMGLQLAGNWHSELTRATLAATLGPKRAGELFPPGPAGMPVTLAAEAAASLLAATPEAAEPRLASNIWAVAGGRTASGKPLLANDPHLALQAPTLWYLAAIEAPGISLAGATVPGSPFHLIGHNGRLAWGFTTTHADTVDLFVEKLVGEDSYATPQGPRPFQRRTEVIGIKGEADVTLAVRETRHGPVISDVTAEAAAGPGEVVAFAAAGLAADDRTAQAFFHLNRAANADGFVAALKDFHSPVQNIAYADTAGAIGFATVGRIPIRRSGDGSVPARGWSGENDWTGWVPFTKLPHTRSPRSGLLVNANNRVVPPSYPYLITADWPDGFRAQRIGEMLKDRKGLTVADMAAMQLDTLSLVALELKELLTAVDPASPRAAEALRLVAAWDGRMARGRPEPLIFSAWSERLNRLIFADELGANFRAMVPIHPNALTAALTRNRHWCDAVSTPAAEDCEAMIARALDETVQALSGTYGADIAKWRWEDAHRAKLTSPVLGKVPLLSRLTEIDLGTDGDDFTVARGSFIPAEGETRFPHLHGAGLRAIFDLADLSRSRFILATGQSGNPLSRHYADMAEAWRDNRGVGLDGRGTAVLTLEPAR